jgi:hypothetical protein
VDVEPCEVGTVEFDVLRRDGDCVVLRMVGLMEIFMVWIFEMTWNGALSVPMRKETDNWLPPMRGWTGPSFVSQVGPRSGVPLR